MMKTSQCNSPESPLSELVVDPSGYCLGYTADDLSLTNGSATTDSLSQEPEELNDADEAEAEMEKLD